MRRFLNLRNRRNDELGCKISYKQNEMIKPNFIMQTSQWERWAHSRKEEKRSTFSLDFSRTLSCDLWSSCFILNINCEQRNGRLFSSPGRFLCGKEYILSITRSPASPKLVVKYKHSLGLSLIVPCFLELRPHWCRSPGDDLHLGSLALAHQDPNSIFPGFQGFPVCALF